MRLLIQRVSEASVRIDGQIKCEIQHGLLLLLGVEQADSLEDISYLVQKVCAMRIFGDEDGKMNLSIQDVKGSFLVVSQFTLHASTKKGNRPSFIQASKPDHAIPLYEAFLESLKKTSNLSVEAGVFGADMKVSLVNDGPVTIWMDSKQKV